MAVKPWLGAIRAPKNPPPISAEPPAVKLTTKWVHGYTSGLVGGTRIRVSSNLYFNSQGDAIYPAAALGVKLSKEASSSSKGGSSAALSQKYFTGHNDDIICLTMSPNRLFVATGQCASVNDMTKETKGKGSICIWDAVTCTLLSKIVGCHQRAVTSLAFSPNSDQLLSVGQDDVNTHTLYSDVGGNWSRVTKAGTSKGDKTPVMFNKWLALEHPKVRDDEYEVVTGGGANINFWKIEGGNMSKKSGKFGRKYKQVPLLCAGNLKIKDGWRVVCGTSTGDLYLFDDNKEVTNAVEKAHAGAILCMVDVGGEDSGSAGAAGSAGGGGRLACGYLLLTGSKDGTVKIWNQSLQPVSTFDANAYSLKDGAIGSVDIINMQQGSGDKVSKLLLGTYGGEIIEVTLPEVAGGPGSGSKGGGSGGKGVLLPAANIVTDFSNARTRVLLYSHFGGELWGVATHPLDADLYATVGDEGTLRVWSIEHNCLIASMPLYHPARCVSWNHSGTVLAVGFHEAVKGGVKKKKSKSKSKSKADDSSDDDEAKVDPNKHAGAVHLYSFNGQQAMVALQQVVSLNASGGVRAPPVGTSAAQPSSNNQLMLPNSGAVLTKRADGCKLTSAWVSEVRFSPDDALLAVASHDKKCYVYAVPSVSDAFRASAKIPTSGGGGSMGEGSGPWDAAWSSCLSGKPRFIFNKHSGAITHVDFTSDSKYMQTNCNAYELLYCDTSNGKQETSASKLANYNNSILGGDDGEEDEDEGGAKQWSTQTCTLGWPVQGIWPAGADGTDINAVDRHFSHKYVATSDDFGLLKLFRYPCVKENSKFVVGKGHSSHVTCVRWAQHTTNLAGADAPSSSGSAKTSTCEYAITTGGNDKCVMVWEVKER